MENARPRLRPVTDDDVDDVLALNERNVTALAPLTVDRLDLLRGWADRADVIDVAGRFAGFVLTMPPGTDYDSENYRWFTERYADRFAYLDRIVLHEDFRRRGLGSFVYDAVEAHAAPYTRMVLEVNVMPRNEASLAFHAHRGYLEVGRLGDHLHQVSLMEKPL